jgi:hypothetical protein
MNLQVSMSEIYSSFCLQACGLLEGEILAGTPLITCPPDRVPVGDSVPCTPDV